MFQKLSDFSIRQRLVILVALAAAVAGLIAVALWTQQPDMQVLFSNLATDDAAAIVEKLKDAKVPYETTAGGTTILVPSAQVHDLRLQLAGQGLPRGGGIGFEIFDRSTLGMSEFVQKLNYRRALQGELARTIAQMPEVERARVHLALPERRLFATEQDRPRASVVVALRNGQVLGKAQVQGIVHLVASSVEGLATKDVTVVDGHGHLLSAPAAAEESAQLTGSQLEYQRTLEKEIETRIQTMLERIVGVNKAVVRVSSVLDFRKIETTEERFDPNGQVVRSEQRGQERTSGINGVSGGVPGVQSNVPPGAEAEPAQTSSTNTQMKNETINYEISRTVSRIVEPIGTIKKLSVAVLVDGTYEIVKPAAGETPAAEPVRKYIPRSEAEMKQIEDIVKKAMGYSAERQDQVQVVNVQFGFGAEDGTPTGAEAEASPAKAWAPYVRYAVGAALFVLILLFVVRPLLGMLAATIRPKDLAETPPLPAPVRDVETALGGGTRPRTTVVELAKSNPESAAVVVRQWLKSNV
ncbi:flagellar basal-body MS-ring/collar protein FliF [Nitrospira calida]|jgi:flagellar M-ring protein FliF